MTQTLLDNQLRNLLGISSDAELASFLRCVHTLAGGTGIDPQHATALRGLKPLLDAVAATYTRQNARFAASEARLHAFVDISSDWYWEQDEDYRFTMISSSISKSTDDRVSHYIGKTRLEVHGGNPAAPEWIAHQRMLDLREPLRDLEFSHQGRDGNVMHISVSGIPVYDESNRFTGYRGITRDITERKIADQQLRDNLRFIETLLDSLPYPVTVKDREHRLVRVNAAHAREFGMDRNAVLGKTAVDLGRNNARELHEIERQLLETPGVKSFTQAWRTKRGEIRNHAVTKASICDEQGAVTGFITTFVDITDLKAAEIKAEEQLRLTSAILESSPAPMMVKDRERNITYINSAYENLFGVRRSAILYHTMRAGHADENAAKIEAIDTELLANPGTRQIEMTLPAAGGREVFCIITKSTFMDASGETGGVVTTYSDITALKAAESAASEQLRLTHILLEASPAPTVVKDRNLTLISCNTAYEHLFEVKRDDIQNQPLATHRSEIAAEVDKIERGLLANPGTHQIERTIVSPSGRRIHCIVIKSTYSNAAGEVSGIITTFTDISELKRTEENLIAAKQAAEAAVHARSQFLANMSHEIRTPMNGVLGMTGLLRATLLNQEQREFVDTLKMSGEALLKIISDILDFSKIEAGKIEIDQAAFDIRSQVTGMVQLFAAAARERNLQLTHEVADDVPQIVMGDAVRIGQALSNIVANAVKFTLTGGVHLGVNVAERNGENVLLQFSVVDSGIGISQDALERIFRPFSQADSSTTRRFGGTGLGLTISRELVKLMGGELHVESIPGKGSRFTFTVQVLTQTTPAALDLPSAEISNSRQPVKGNAAVEVLLAEDNKVNQMVSTKMLEKLGCRVTVASDGAEAVDWAARRSFDLILMDCHMPNMDGFAATAAIRAMEKGGNVRRTIVAQTANAMEGDRDVCLAASMDDYIAKPFTMDKLADIIQRWAPDATGG